MPSTLKFQPHIWSVRDFVQSLLNNEHADVIRHGCIFALVALVPLSFILVISKAPPNQGLYSQLQHAEIMNRHVAIIGFGRASITSLIPGSGSIISSRALQTTRHLHHVRTVSQDSTKIQKLARHAIWRREAPHQIQPSVRHFSSIYRALEESKSRVGESTEEQLATSTKEQLATSTTSKHVIDRLAHIHRPTKAELLSAATGFWHRLGIRFKWFSIRSGRPFSFEEIFTFASWIFWGHVLWIFIGTTTFVSLAILTFNTVFAQETLAKWIGNYLTHSSGLRVVFESAIVPKWKDGVISFSNVFVSRRPGIDKRDRSVSKGSQTAAAAAAAASHLVREKDDSAPLDDGNYTQFDVTIETVNVTLSFTKWFNGRGLLHDVEVKGVRGVVDRTSVHNVGGWGDPKSWRHEHNPGDFEIDAFKMEDVLLTVYQPNGFRPFTISVFNCELPRLRKQWLFYDFLNAKTMTGSFDNSLFTIHPRQVHNYTGVPLVDGAEAGPSQWKKQSRMRIDGLRIDHLNRGVEGPFGWIYEGNVDIVADVMIPHDENGSIAQLMSSIYDQVEATVVQAQSSRRDSRSIEEREHHEDRYVIFDVQIHLNDVRASIPLFNNDLSYVNNALVRPIVAYINSRRSFIPITCRIVKQYHDFDGSWTFFDSGLLDELSREVYDAFVRDIMDGDVRIRRMKKVGLWTLQVAAQALFLGLAGQLA